MNPSEIARVKKLKLQRLLESEATTLEACAEMAVMDGLCPAICLNDGCDWTTNYEPDQDRGYCEACETNSVGSALVLAGCI